MTQPKTPAKRPSLRQKVDAARKKTPIFKSPEFVEDSDEETAIEPDKLEVVTPVESEKLVHHIEIEVTVVEAPKENQTVEPEVAAAPEIEQDDKVIEAAVVQDAESEEDPTVEEEPTEIEKPKNAAFVWYYKRTDTRPSTHSSMIGGSFVVPLDQRKIFQEEYFNVFFRWLNTSPITPPTLFLTERYNDEYFRFFVDIDYEWDASPSPILDTINTVTRAVRHVLGYLDDNSYNCILEERASGRTAYKLHLVFPQVITSPSTVLLFAQAVEKQVNISAVDFRTATREDFPLKFDLQVYKKGSLRLLGSCKKNGLAPQHENETEFFYMPIDSSGERTKTITYEEFARHSILLDKETHDRVAQSMESGDGVVFLPKDDSYGEDLLVTSKFVPSGNVHMIRPEMTVYTAYTGSGRVSSASELYNCILKNYGEVIANASTRSPIIHDPYKNCSTISLSSTFWCPFYGEHQNQHPYISLTEYGMRLKCHSPKRPACIKGGVLIRRDTLPPAVVAELPSPKEPEILEDVCGGGESDQADSEAGEETAVERRPKKIRRKSKAKKNRDADEATVIPDADVIDRNDLNKDTLASLYDKKKDTHQQSSFTRYLNNFVAYVHANDTYGFRENRMDPFTLGKKSTTANKLQRYNAGFDAFSIWSENDNRREYKSCVFDTSAKTHGDNILNLFKGYKAQLLDEQISAESVEPFLYHIREIYCSGNQQYNDYFVRWWAWLFQKGRTGIMALLTSPEKGTGKNILLELIAEHIIGDQYVATTDKITTLTQRFNALNAEKALIVVNELKDATKSKKEQAGCADVLKTLIKDRTVTIEKKSIDPISVPSTANLVGTSQYTVPIKIDDDQRRFFVLKVSDKKKGDGNYFDTLAAFVQTNAERIYTFLMQVDLKGWHPERNLPQTEYVKQIQAAFRNPIYTFWRNSEWATHNFVDIPTESDTIFTQYKTWCLHNGYTPPNDRWFGRLVHEMGYDIKREQHYGKRGQWITGSMKDEIRTKYIDTIG